MDESKDKFSALEDVKRDDSNGVGLVTLSSGVVLKAIPVSPLVLMKLTARYEEPKVPMFFDG